MFIWEPNTNIERGVVRVRATREYYNECTIVTIFWKYEVGITQVKW